MKKKIENKDMLLPSGIYKKRLMKKIFKKYKFNSPLLDIGCGTGSLIIELLNKNFKKVDGIDIDNDTVEIAQRRLENKNSEVFYGNFMDYKFSNMYNCVMIFEVFEHIEKDVDAMKRINSILNKGSYMIFSTPAHQKLYSAEDSYHGHVRRYEKKEIVNKLKESGFEVCELWSYSYFVYLTNLIVGKSKKDKNRNLMDNTKKSSYRMHPKIHKLVTMFGPVIRCFSFILNIQDLFLNKDRGAHYLVVARKK